MFKQHLWVYIIFVCLEHSNSKTLKTSQSSISNEGSLSTGNKKSVVSVVLTEEATIPGQLFLLHINIDIFLFVHACKDVKMICLQIFELHWIASGVFKLVPLEERSAETDLQSIKLQDQVNIIVYRFGVIRLEFGAYYLNVHIILIFYVNVMSMSMILLYWIQSQSVEPTTDATSHEAGTEIDLKSR